MDPREKYPAVTGVFIMFLMVVAITGVASLVGYSIDQLSGAEPVPWGKDVEERTGPCADASSNWTDGTCYTEARNWVGGFGYAFMFMLPFLLAFAFAHDISRKPEVDE